MNKKLKDGEVAIIRSNNQIILGNSKGLKLVLNQEQYKDLTDDQLVKLFNEKRVYCVSGGGANE